MLGTQKLRLVVTRRFWLWAGAAVVLLAAGAPTSSQSVGSGGISQRLRVYDEVDLHAFRNVLKTHELYFKTQIQSGNPITDIDFRRFGTSQFGSRVYLGYVQAETQPTPPPMVPRTNFLYLYTGTTPLPIVPPDRVKYYPTIAPAQNNLVILPSTACYDFTTNVLGNPPQEVIDLLNGRTIVGIHSYAGVGGGSGQELFLEIYYDGGTQSLPVTVVISADCTVGGTVCGAYTVTVQ